MEIKTKHEQLNQRITLCHPSNSPFPINVLALAATKLEDELIECRLTFHVNLELHQRITTETLFNLKPEIRIPLSSQDFSPELDIQIEISLPPDFLPTLKEHITNLEEVSTNFLNLKQTQPDHPLFATENWLLVSATQQQESTQVGYHTLWHYLNPVTLVQAAVSGSADPISEILGNFFKDWTQNNLSTVTETANTELFDGIANFFKGFADFSLNDLTTVIKDIEQQLTKDWQPPTLGKTILQQMLNFFTEDDWNFTKLQGESVLLLTFPGKNGIWNCYAKAREEKKQFVFYSLCPITAPVDKRQAIAEFLSRANYGMMIGNFEFDFNDGEIRYKTSIDIEGERLSFSCIKNLVYTNVNMMDKYLPGIMSVINGDIAPASAIEQTELIPDIPQSSNEKEQLSDVLPAKKHEELKLNPSWLTDIQKQEIKREKESHILSKLTPEEIAQFHQVSQMVAPYQRKKVQEITEKLKSVIITRLGESGEDIFTKASTFFLEVKLEAKNFKLIQRYSGLAGRTRLLLQHLNNWSKQYGELPANSQGRIALVELDNLFWRIDERLQELPTDKFEGGKEVQLLVEIEELREHLGVYDHLITKIDKNPDIGLASTQ